MKRIFFIFLVLVMVFGAGSLFAADFQVGALVEGVSNPIGSLDIRAELGPFTLEPSAGFTTLKFANPTVTIDDKEQDMPWKNIELKAHVWLLQGGLFINWWRPPHMVVYTGARGSAGLLGVDFNMRFESDNPYWYWYEEVNVDAHSVVGRIKFIVLGWDWRIPNVPNTVFSVGVGVQKWWIPTLNATMTSEYEEEGMEEPDIYESKIEIDPGLSGWNTCIEAGVRVSFGGHKD